MRDHWKEEWRRKLQRIERGWDSSWSCIEARAKEYSTRLALHNGRKCKMLDDSSKMN